MTTATEDLQNLSLDFEIPSIHQSTREPAQKTRRTWLPVDGTKDFKLQQPAASSQRPRSIKDRHLKLSVLSALSHATTIPCRLYFRVATIPTFTKISSARPKFLTLHHPIRRSAYCISPSLPSHPPSRSSSADRFLLLPSVSPPFELYLEILVLDHSIR